MEKKRNYLKIVILSLSVIIFLVASFFVCKTLFGKKDTIEVVDTSFTPILYKVTKDNSNNEMYLFGSIHMAKSRDLYYPDYIIDAYNKSHYLACEIDESKMNSDPELTNQLIMAMMYSDNTTIKDHLDEKTYNKLVNYLTEKGLYSNVYELYKPMFFYSLLSTSMGNDANLETTAGVDNYFINKAKKDGKTILEVESMEYQTNLLISFSDKLYALLINEALDNYDKGVEDLKNLYDNWKKGNEEKILELNDEDIKENDKYPKDLLKEIEIYNKKVIYDRNISMTDKAIEYFDSNKDVFFMVGALHIVGDNGIANNLRNKGYTVTRVYP